MIDIPVSLITGWDTRQTPRQPLAISLKCGKCRQFATFVLADGKWVESQTFVAVVNCPNPKCKSTTRFMGFELDSNSRFSKLSVDPAPELMRQAMEHLELVPEKVKNAYQASLDAYNSGLPDSVSVVSRRTLEGAIKMLWENPEETRGKSLHSLIESLHEKFDLAKPMTDLAHAMRQGGNLAAHFDLDKEMNPKIAEKMIEMIEYILEYLYIIPKRIEELQAEI